MKKIILQILERWLNAEVDAYTSSTKFNKILLDIRPGDVLLVEGRSRASRVISFLTKSRWTHAALVTRDMSDTIKSHPLIIDSHFGMGTQLCSIYKYSGYNLRICRPKALTYAQVSTAINHAKERIGTGYNLLHIWDLLRFFCPWPIIPRNWRQPLFVYNAQKPTEEICSHLIGSAFAACGYELMNERDLRLITPKEFDNTELFDIIR